MVQWAAVKASLVLCAVILVSGLRARADAALEKRVQDIIDALDDPDPAARQLASDRLVNLPGDAYDRVVAAAKPDDVSPAAMAQVKAALLTLKPRHDRRQQSVGRARDETLEATDLYTRFSRHDPKWDAAASAALAGLADVIDTSDPLPGRRALALFRGAIQAGCDDVLIVSRYSRLLKNVDRERWQRDADTASRVLHSADTALPSGYPADVQCVSLLAAADLLHARNEDLSRARRYWEASARLLNGSANISTDRLHRVVEFQYETGLPLFRDPYIAFIASYPVYQRAASDAAGPWLFKGQAFLNWAWSIRGTDDLRMVPPDHVWAYHVRVDGAALALERAWERNPHDAVVANEMLTACLALGPSRGRMELWFKRAIDADGDDVAACRQKMYWLWPRWYGNIDDMLVFGHECLQTRNFRSRIALMLVEAHVAIADQSGDPERYYQQPDVWRDIRDCMEPCVKVFPDDAYDRSLYAKLAVRCGQWAAAKEQFDAMGERVDRSFFPDQHEYDRVRLEAAKRANVSR